MSEENWMSALPEELQASPALADVKSFESLAKQFVDQQAHLGTSIRIPGEEASAEDITAFNNKLIEKAPNLMVKPDADDEDQMNAAWKMFGRPENDEGYAFPEVEGIKLTGEKADFWRKAALSAGLTKGQFSGLLTQLMGVEASGNELSAKALTDSYQELETKWGALYGDRMTAISHMAAQTEMPEAMKEAITNKTMNTDTLTWMASMFQKLSGEGTEFSQQGKGPASDAIIPSEAIEKAAEVRKKLTSGTVMINSPEYQVLLDKLVKYESLATPKASTKINDLRAGFSSGM